MFLVSFCRHVDVVDELLIGRYRLEQCGTRVKLVIVEREMSWSIYDRRGICQQAMRD